MNTAPADTIVALATPPGRGGVGVIRISGPLVKSISENLLGKLPKPRHATFSKFYDAEKKAIDEGIALFFPNPASFTGEDVLELHGHGGVVIGSLLQKRIVELGARIARPGEFSERAFLNDKLDLVQAEAIADLIDASSEQSARSAYRSLQGEFSERINILLNDLIYLRSYVEAAIDFVEEEIDFLGDEKLLTKLNALITAVKNILASANQGCLLREGITAVIAGCPNVGKSSLLNSLSEKETAIVTAIPGTTRDVLRETILIDGLPLHIIDTAGLRESEDLVEQIGIRRAWKEINNADLVIYVVDAVDFKIDSALFEKLSPRAQVLIVKNKIDLTNESPALLSFEDKPVVAVSVKTGLGLDLFKQQIKNMAGFETSEGIFSARARHTNALQETHTFLQEGLKQLQQTKAAELLAENLRQAQLALSEITGAFSSDDLLGKIFSSFCIGK